MKSWLENVIAMQRARGSDDWLMTGNYLRLDWLTVGISLNPYWLIFRGYRTNDGLFHTADNATVP